MKSGKVFNHGCTRMHTDKKGPLVYGICVYPSRVFGSVVEYILSFRASRSILTTPTALNNSAQGWSEATTLGNGTQNFIAPFRSLRASGRGLGVGENNLNPLNSQRCSSLSLDLSDLTGLGTTRFRRVMNG